MAKPRRKYQVYTAYYFYSEEYEDCHVDKWTHEGSTWAVSEKQAINNVRHRSYGDYGSSQYKPLNCEGSYENGLMWLAIASDFPLSEEELKKYDRSWRGSQGWSK